MEIGTRVALMSGWLGQIDPSIADSILENGTLTQFNDGETIYGFGQPQDSLHGVVSGCVKMWITMNEQEPRFGHLVAPGFWFGETEVITGKPGVIEMVVASSTEILSIGRREIDRLSAAHPAIWPSVTLLAVLNQGVAIGAADDLMIRDSRKRLAAVLLRLSARRNAYQNTPPLDTIPVNWNELSEAASLSRSKVGALLAEFSRQGLLATKHKRIDILQPDGLAEVLKG